MTSFLLSRASSNFPRFKLPLDYSKVSQQSQTHLSRRPRPRRTAQKSSASGYDYASLQYMLGDEGGVG